MSEDNFVLFENVEIAPFRTIGDFITDARFELPAFNDLPKWNKRITTNLLYFQTNYFIVFVAFLLLTVSFYGQDVFMGIFAIAAAFLAYIVALSQNERIKEIRTVYPYPVWGIAALCTFFFVNQLSCVFTTLFCLLFSLIPIFIHASLRLRNFNAKLNLELESVKFRRTVMSSILGSCGIELK